MSDELRIDSGALIFATLADVYLSSGMVDEAISILKDGLARNPNYNLAKIILGRAYYIKGNIEEAIKTLEGIYEAAKDSENTNLYLGHCYKKIGDVEKAIKYYEAALKINFENIEAKRELEALRPELVTRIEAQKAPPETEPVPISSEEPKPVEIIEEVKEEEIEKVAEPEIEEVSGSPFEALDEPMKRLLNLRTVKGAFIVSKDGLLIKNYYEGRRDVEEMCASIASICIEAADALNFLPTDGLERCVIEKENETICIITAGESLLTIITEPETKPGLVYIYARRLIEEIKEILG